MSTSTRDKRGMGTKKRAGRPKNPTTTTLPTQNNGVPKLPGRGGGQGRRKGGRYENTKNIELTNTHTKPHVFKLIHRVCPHPQPWLGGPPSTPTLIKKEKTLNPLLHFTKTTISTSY